MTAYRSDNKKLGTAFEKKAVSLLAKLGYWVHFISPDPTGAQPFDVIAVRNGKAIAIDCKTSVAKRFNISRLEDNQILAFEKWLKCGNEMPIILVEHDERIYIVYYDVLKKNRIVELKECVSIGGKDEEDIL